MSGLLGAFTQTDSAIREVLLQRMVGGLQARGADCSAAWSREGATLAVSRNDWERSPDLSGDILLLWDGEVTIAADASLYYRADLERKLAVAGSPLNGPTPSHLILSAYSTWGTGCVRHLEGDYAFIIWDQRRRTVFCARDHTGNRPLFYTRIGQTFLVASTMAALRAHPGCPSDLNHAVLAESAANLWMSTHETPYAAISALPAGCSLAWNPTGTVSVARHWHPPEVSSYGAAPFSDAADELRQRLSRAVGERLARTGTTTVWMSGGRDSTAVFAAGLHAQPAGADLLPVSVSYPRGDSGREDETISAVAQRWNVPVQWLDSREIPLFDRPQEGAARRDEPSGPLYENFNRFLARGSRSLSAHIALDGWGGDQLFGSSPILLADLFRTGRWLSLAREWRKLQIRDLRFFFRLAITPALPSFMRAAASILRGGRPLTSEFDTEIPDWIRTERVRTLADRQKQHRPAAPRHCSLASHELFQFLTSGTATRARGWLSALALEEGVEVRSPLYDARLITFAVRRPVSERRSGRDTKVLLRAAMRGLLPDQVLAPRVNRAGVMDDYLRNAMRASFPLLLDELFAAPVLLAELGIIEPGALRRAAEDGLSRSWNEQIAVALLSTLQTELWLRARLGEQPILTTMANGWPSFHRASGPATQHHGGN